jgi:microcystin-dependent protein
MPTTTRLELPYPTVDDEPSGATQIQALAERLDTVVYAPEPGDLKFSARVNEHGNWIKADGRTLAAGTYTALRDALIADGSPFGATGGDPKIPDLRGRAPISAGAGAGLTARTVGQVGGAEQHTLTEAQMPNHQHAAVTGQPEWAFGLNTGAALGAAGTQVGVVQSTTPATASTGGGQPHNNMPPFTVGTWFIYAA